MSNVNLEVCSAGGTCSVWREESREAVSGYNVACDKTIEAIVDKSSDLGRADVAFAGANRSGCVDAGFISQDFQGLKNNQSPT